MKFMWRPEAAATACMEWDEQCKTETGPREWLKPESEVKEIAELLRTIGASEAMNLGCGTGRHSLFLASLGYSVFAIEGSASAVNFARLLARRQMRPIHFVTGLMTDLPCADESFDYLLAWNVIYQGNQGVIRKSLSEIHRVLRPGGIFQGTMLSKKNRLFGQVQKAAAEAFVFEKEPDKRYPHFYCNQTELAALLDPMELLRVNDLEHECPGSYHLHFVAMRVHLQDPA
ncbi:Methyltransferase domain protein [Syntrophobacter sp. SbD2]|nr:Methyltransferase domain protein [Syntrophobacter sp. SbD2]